MNNITTLQQNLAAFDLSKLSLNANSQVYGLMKQISLIIVGDFVTNPTSTSDQISSIFTTISAAQTLNKPTPPIAQLGV